jgi:NAD(P)-dependent dehydrogenase (short-subunit alcohol dehydrogenase family)
MTGRLEGKVAVITGATSGIGLATAKRFAKEGARLFMTGRRERELGAAVDEIGHNARGIQGDVGNLADLDHLYSVVKAEAGAIDVLFANAGGGDFAALGAITEEHFDRIFRINVRGTLFTVQKALPLLRDDGSIILTGSTAGTTGTPGFSVYSASKAAIRNFARNWILDLGGSKDPRQCAGARSDFDPRWHDLATSDEAHEEMIRFVSKTTPLGRLANPEEAANAALFLASSESSFVNGIELFVDGGSAQI